ncbi:MAG TPA: tetratricopeptide repeat protein [Candidatus Aminicenantes bacterium]|nr:tetratricopeptide repeat protein [Acidobacteriota bacterium]HOI44320.1 tetratricopeptide repeat protein [Candidatus Aminicenantes bacterium]
MKKLMLLLLLAFAGSAEIAIYRSVHLYNQATGKIVDPQDRIHVLEKAVGAFPLNDRAHFELGKAYFELGINHLTDIARRDSFFNQSYRSLIRSLSLNPGSVQAHFHLAQTVQYMDFLSLPAEISSFEEYKKSALLTGHNTQVYYEVGKILLARWPDLSDAERVFTQDILKTMLAGKDAGKLQSLLQVWAVNVNDYSVLDKIIPRDKGILRTIAQFLGERSLSLEERQKKLAEAEALEFNEARSNYDAAGREIQLFRLSEAAEKLAAARDLLSGIRFYQDLTHEALIDRGEFEALCRNVRLALAECRIEETGRFEEAEDDLLKYLESERDVAAVARLEGWLLDRGLIDGRLDSDMKNFRRLFFHILLSFKQNRYRDISRVGDILRRSLLVVPPAMVRDYVKVLQIIGDSYQKLDYIYEAESFYQKALEIEPDNLEALSRLRRSQERMNKEQSQREIEARIRKLTTLGETVFENLRIGKGQSHALPLVAAGGKLDIVIEFEYSEPAPLVSVVFNGRVVWERYFRGSGAAFSIEPDVGENRLQILPVNRDVTLGRMSVVLPREPEYQGG